jgi:hypothetical protein
VGLTFFSPEHQCSLATTFRSLPESDLGRNDDTVLRTMNLKLEASCTASASAASSRLHLIEVASHPRPPIRSEETLYEIDLGIAAVRCFWQGVHHFQARSRLSNLRHYYSHLQGDGTHPSGIEGQTQSLDLSKPEILACCSYLLIWIMHGLHRQRRPSQANPSERSRSQLGAIFVLSHVVAHYVIGKKMQHSSRVAGLVSLYGLAGYVL